MSVLSQDFQLKAAFADFSRTIYFQYSKNIVSIYHTVSQPLFGPVEPLAKIKVDVGMLRRNSAHAPKQKKSGAQNRPLKVLDDFIVGFCFGL